jgi:Na+/proline symporter
MLPLFISLCTRQLYPDHVNGDTQLALPRMVMEHTHLVVQVLFFGSLLSAIMSTTSSAILAPAAIVSENLVRPLVKQPLSDRQMLLLTRAAVLLFSAIGTAMACMRSNIYELVGESSILSLVSLFAPLVLGLYWRKASSGGAILAMVGGTVTWVILQFIAWDVPSLVPATLVSLLGMFLGSWIWKKPAVAAQTTSS